ncbi:hypothetical protein [Psychrobacter aquimaris]|uniref:hypothetical protein n=1 Tax=Psychrobacter aquimaris TaxID=292733 RepID=UPI0018DF46B3|nr:hypothetical protein [Psychrobacter aquimaris]
MKNKLVSFTVAAALALTVVSAYAAPAAKTSTKPATPLKIGTTDNDGLTRYKGKTIVSGILEYNMVNEAGFPAEFTVDNESKVMIPKVPKTNYPTQFALESDNPQIERLKLNKKKCYRIPMTIEIDGYYSSSYEGEYDGANLLKIIKKGTPVLTSCNVG